MFTPPAPYIVQSSVAAWAAASDSQRAWPSTSRSEYPQLVWMYQAGKTLVSLQSGNRMVLLQEDGNLVLYTVDRRVAWASNTDTRSSDAYTLEVSSSYSQREQETAPLMLLGDTSASWTRR